MTIRDITATGRAAITIIMTMIMTARDNFADRIGPDRPVSDLM